MVITEEKVIYARFLLFPLRPVDESFARLSCVQRHPISHEESIYYSSPCYQFYKWSRRSLSEINNMPLYFTFQRANSALSTLCGITNFSQQLNNFDTIKGSVTERRIMSLGTCSQVLEAGFTLICYIIEQFVVYVASENNEVNCIFQICRERLGGIWKSFNFCPQRVTFKVTG